MAGQIVYVEYVYLTDKKYLTLIYFNLKLFLMTIDQIYCNVILEIIFFFLIFSRFF